MESHKPEPKPGGDANGEFEVCQQASNQWPLAPIRLTPHFRVIRDHVIRSLDIDRKIAIASQRVKLSAMGNEGQAGFCIGKEMPSSTGNTYGLTDLQHFVHAA